MGRGRPLLDRGLPAQWLSVTDSWRLQGLAPLSVLLNRQGCLELREEPSPHPGQEHGWVLRATLCPLSHWQSVPGITETVIRWAASTLQGSGGHGRVPKTWLNRL